MPEKAGIQGQRRGARPWIPAWEAVKELPIGWSSTLRGFPEDASRRTQDAFAAGTSASLQFFHSPLLRWIQ